MTHDSRGARINAAEYHPAYHELMSLSLESGAAAFAWGEHARCVGCEGFQTTRLSSLTLQL